MKNFTKLAVLSLLLVLSINVSYSQIDPGGGDCPVPGTCDEFDEPGNLPIDSKTVLILLGGLAISAVAVIKLKRSAKRNIV